MSFSVGPNLQPYQHHFLENYLPARLDRVMISYWGANSLVISDRDSTLLVDPHFSRPGIASLFRRQRPDHIKIWYYLGEAGARQADAVLLTHAHYDHAMDAAFTVKRTGARLVGSRSAMMIGRGGGVPEDQLRAIESKEDVQVGNFLITFIRSSHVPFPFPLSLIAGIDQPVEAPLVSPAHIWEFKAGETFILHIAHPDGNMVISGSAGWVSGSLNGWQADVVILASGGLVWQGKRYMRSYYLETVTAVQAKRVLVSHWDDFTRPLDAPLRLGGLSARNLEFLAGIAQEVDGCTFHMMPVGQMITLFEEKGEGL
jgi:L-ascorbate metabolism protein UlaG (beta-lactamase superfamily)